MWCVRGWLLKRWCWRGWHCDHISLGKSHIFFKVHLYLFFICLLFLFILPFCGLHRSRVNTKQQRSEPKKKNQIGRRRRGREGWQQGEVGVSLFVWYGEKHSGRKRERGIQCVRFTSCDQFFLKSRLPQHQWRRGERKEEESAVQSCCCILFPSTELQTSEDCSYRTIAYWCFRPQDYKSLRLLLFMTELFNLQNNPMDLARHVAFVHLSGRDNQLKTIDFCDVKWVLLAFCFNDSMCFSNFQDLNLNVFLCFSMQLHWTLTVLTLSY